MTRIKRNRLLLTILTAIFIIGGSIAAISFARGYRPNLKGGTIQGTGLLSATSYPKSAQVFIDNKLTSATDTTITLLPGDYHVKIVKEGFLPWEKLIKIQAELVSTTDARLFPAVPSLAAVTYTGSIRPETSPDGRRIAYFVNDSVTEDKKGLYVMDLGNSPLSFNRSPIQISHLHSTYKMENSQLLWSPDSKQILLAFFDPAVKKSNVIQASYLLDTNTLNNFAATPDVSVRLSIILSQWEQDLYQNETADLKTLPDFISNLATSSAINLYFSPDKEKIVYTSTTKVSLPDHLKQAVSSINPTPQNRNLEAGSVYVYDLKEDTNYLLGAATKNSLSKSALVNIVGTPTTGTSTNSSTPTKVLFNQLQKDKTIIETINLFKAHYSPLYTSSPSWYQTSRHLITNVDNKITIFEYDNNNHSVVYSGPFDNSFLMSSPTGDRLLILTNLNQNDSPTNLYSLDLK